VPLHEAGKEEAGRAAANDRYLHLPLASFLRRFGHLTD